MEKRNHYWVLDCILALTAIALGTAALCSFVGVAIPPRSGIALSLEALVCVAALVVGALFAGFVSRDQHRPGRRHAVRAHQERHAMMMRRESERFAEVRIAQPESAEPAQTPETPETLLVTSLTDVEAERRVQRRQRARLAAEATVSA